MAHTEHSLSETILSFSENFIQHYQQQHGQLPIIEKDEEWPSACEVGKEDEQGMIAWQPVKMQKDVDFKNVEKALNIELHPSINDYFSQIYSESIPAMCDEGYLELLFAWNQQDFERLQQNIIGHVMMKKKLKQAITIFFAVTDEDDINIVIKNDTGEVWAEPVGLEPNKYLAASVKEFVANLRMVDSNS